MYLSINIIFKFVSIFRYVQAFLASLVIDMPADVWIGLTDSLTPGIFESWTGGTTLQFTYWFKQHTGK